MAVIKVELNDPQLREKAERFFLETYREKQAERRDRLAKEKSDSPAERDGADFWHLDPDNLPDDYLSVDDFRHLLSVRNKIIKVSSGPLPDIDNGADAGVILVRLNILAATQRMLEQLLMYLLLDTTFHPGRKCNAKAIGVLGLGDEELQQKRAVQVDVLVQSTALCNAMLLPRKPNLLLVDQLKMLHSVGEIFFNTLQSIFQLPAVNKCRIAFTRLMRDLGLNSSNEIAANYIRRRRAMQSAIEKYEAHGGAVKQDRVALAVKESGEAIKSLKDLAEEVKTVGVSTEALSKKLDNIDRRQKTLHNRINSIMFGFVHLFAPRHGKPGPTFGEIKQTLLPEERYACLQKINEPHRSQLKQVIDYTKTHPIVHRQKNGDQFSLSNAAHAVWNQEHAKWECTAGSFTSFAQLKAACYNLQNGKHDPFYYSN